MGLGDEANTGDPTVVLASGLRRALLDMELELDWKKDEETDGMPQAQHVQLLSCMPWNTEA